MKKGHFIHWLYCRNKGEKTELELNAANTHSQQAAYEYLHRGAVIIYSKYKSLNYVYSILSPYFVFPCPFDSSGLDTERHKQTELNIQH